MNTLLLCLEIFLARFCDVSIGAVRTVFLVKQKNLIAGILAFIEIVIWFFVAREVLTGREINLFIVISYAGGYAFGTYAGGLINKYFIKGNLTAMVIIDNKYKSLVNTLKKENFGVSVLKLEDNKIMLFIEFQKKKLRTLQSIIKKENSSAFTIIMESFYVENGYIH